jgi:hypothetical protein
MKALPVTSVVPDSVAETVTHFFSERQAATFKKLCEIFMPPLKGNPGAIEAGAPEFLEFLVGESPSDRQQMYKGGLDRLEKEAQSKFGGPFAGLSASQADELIRPWLRAWMTDHPPTERFEQFINIAHSDIRAATMNSQAWNDARQRRGEEPSNVDLYWYPVEPEPRRDEAAAVGMSSAARARA